MAKVIRSYEITGDDGGTPYAITVQDVDDKDDMGIMIISDISNTKIGFDHDVATEVADAITKLILDPRSTG